jgi:hypothetical protein
MPEAMVEIVVLVVRSQTRMGEVVNRKWRLGWRVHGRETGFK